jgi:transcriptional activator for dhaKLM operon
MLPSAYPYDRQELKAAWAQFVQNGSVDLPSLDSAVVRSWRHCRDAGLEPYALPQPRRYSTEVLEQRRQARFDLIAIARPFMEDIYQFAGESDMIVYLADEELCILDWLGDKKLQSVLKDMGLSDGVCLAEKQIGTNAASMALREGLPAQIVGPEHFYLAYHPLTDTAAAIHALDGKMMGVIDIVTLEPNSHPHTLGIVMAAARAIDNLLQAEQSFSEAHRRLTELNATLQAVSKGLVFLDPDGDGPADSNDGKGSRLPGHRRASLLPDEHKCAEGRGQSAQVYPHAGTHH